MCVILVYMGRMNQRALGTAKVSSWMVLMCLAFLWVASKVC